MCLVLVAYRSHSDFPLIVAANRDEFYERPTAPAEYWVDAPTVLAGRDLKAGGTWLGVDRRGRFAAVTNYRQGQREDPAPRSRGQLVSDFLTTEVSAIQHLENVRREADLYNGFNLLALDTSGFFYFSNREGPVRKLEPGVYGLSNHLLDTPWPKVVSSKTTFGALLSGDGSELTPKLFALLLSSAFIMSPDYGTRSSTVVLAGYDGAIVFIERSFGPDGTIGPDRRFEFQMRTSTVNS